MGVSRRGFLTLMAGAGTGIMFTPLPWKLLDDASKWSQNWSWIPRNMKGDNSYIPVISKSCPSSLAAMARLVSDRPVRLLPDHKHPLGGGLTALAAAEVEMLYSPSRTAKPLKRSSDGGFVETTWEDAAQIFFNAIKKSGKNTAFVSGDESGTTTEIISAFARSLGSDKMFLMPSEGSVAATAAHLMGLDGQLGYDFENSDFILAIGANILETWGPVISTRKSFFNKRFHPGQEGKAGIELAYASPVQDNTATAAKYWLPILPGTEEVLALGIANELIRGGRRAASDDFSAYRELCAAYSLEKTAEICGVSSDSIKQVVDALLNAKAPIAVAGSGGALGMGAAPVIAAMGINVLLDNINRKGGVTVLPDAPLVVKGAKTRRQIYSKDFYQGLFSKDNELLVINEANPVYAFAGGKEVVEALKAIPFKVAFTPYMTETAMLCDLILPTSPGLERFDDVYTPYGYSKNIYCITRPVKARGESIRHIGDILSVVAKNLGNPLGFAKVEDVFHNKINALGASAEALANGKPFISNQTVPVYSVNFRADVLKKVVANQPAVGTLRLAVSSRLAFGTANTGIPPFNTKTIRANELKGSDMYVSMNASTAAKHGLNENNRVTITSDNGSLSALVHISESVRSDTVAASFGFGHTAFDGFSKDKGANVLAIIKAKAEPQTGLATWSKSSVNVTKA